ncbi:MAG: hypothetical protein RR133_06360 [Kiritimatiellia bacterium]
MRLSIIQFQHRFVRKLHGALSVGVLLLLLALTGCFSDNVAGRIRQKQEAFAAYPADVQSRLERGQIRLGDDATAVWIVYGNPTEKVLRTTATGTVELWIYKILSYAQETYPTVRPIYYDERGRRVATFYTDNTPDYTWKEVLRVEISKGRVSAVQTVQ